jgi:hypothetical protein
MVCRDDGGLTRSNAAKSSAPRAFAVNGGALIWPSVSGARFWSGLLRAQILSYLNGKVATFTTSTAHPNCFKSEQSLTILHTNRRVGARVPEVRLRLPLQGGLQTHRMSVQDIKMPSHSASSFRAGIE